MPVTPREPSGFKSKDERDHPWTFRCDKPECFWVTAHETQERALEIERDHDCPHITPFHQGSMVPAGLEFIKVVWDEMDDLTDQYYDPSTEPEDKQYAKHRLGGMAQVIKHWMPPALNETGFIAQELRKRWQERGKGEMPNTEGVEYRWQPVSTRDVPAVAPITDAKILGRIQQALKHGVELADIAVMYQVNKEQVALVMKGIK